MGRFSDAFVAGPPSPEPPWIPLPATVVIVPPDTIRTRAFLLSAMYRLPEESTDTLEGPFNEALVAAPPSPEKPTVPLPATVVMVPLDTLRIRLLAGSATYRT